MTITTKFGIDGGIGLNPDNFGPVTYTIGLATETNTAISVVGQTSSYTRMGISGGIAVDDPDFSGKQQTLGLAQETNTALPVVDPNDVYLGIGLATETNAARPMSVGEPPTITLVSSVRGTNIITAAATLTVNVNNSSNSTSITVNGVATSGFTVVTPTELTCIVPRGIGTPYSANVNVVVNSTYGASSPFAALWEPPFGMVETDFGVSYGSLDPDSPFDGDNTFQDLVVGDSCIYDAVTTPDNLGVSMSSTGVFTITGTISQIQTFDYYIYDLSDNTVSPSIEQITVQPGPVEAAIGQASETDIAHGVTSNIATIATIGLATETNATLPVTDGSGIVGIIGQAAETDSAISVSAQGPSQTIAIGLVTETDTTFTVADGSTVSSTIGLATEVDTTFPVIDFQAVRALIGQASETNSAITVNFPATLDSLRDQIDDLQAIILAQQLQINDLYTRFDLNTDAPQTYTIDGVTITNDEFTLTKNDNLDGTFTIVKN